jgi:hypothetical protein
MTAVVYHAGPAAGAGRSLLDKTVGLFDRAGGDKIFQPGMSVAVKVHFGEEGNTGYLNPAFARALVRRLSALKTRPFLFDTNTLYRVRRHTTRDHLETARFHGFTEEYVGAPVVIGDEFVETEIAAGGRGKARIAKAVREADAVLVLAHATGHILFGYGGALKSVAMGCAAPSGKQVMHSDVKPAVKEAKCVACGTCVGCCPASAIALVDRAGGKQAARIDPRICLGCGECIAACPVHAIPINWKTEEKPLAEKAALYARAALAGKLDRLLCLNFLLQITPDCDCADWTEPPFVPDLGVLASRDIVAIDQSAIDLIRQAPVIPGSTAVAKRINISKRIPPEVASQFLCLPRLPDVFKTLFGADVSLLTAAAEKAGLGSREYRLEKVE